MKKHRIDIRNYVLFGAVLIAELCLYVILEWRGCQVQNTIWSMISAVATSLLVITAVIGFRKGREVARLQTSLEFCAKMHKQFQEDDFKQREKRIREALMKNPQICPIRQLPKDVQNDIRVYCGFMDNIGVLTEHNSINPDIVIAYYGVEILFNYDLIKPYLELERRQQSQEFANLLIPDSDTQLIKDALRLEYAHFELLALQIRTRGPKLIKDFTKRLRKQNAI